MLECKICGCKFHAVIERHYIARDNGKKGLASAFGSESEESIHDAFDCPGCGCQIIAQERKREYVTQTTYTKIHNCLTRPSEDELYQQTKDQLSKKKKG